MNNSIKLCKEPAKNIIKRVAIRGKRATAAPVMFRVF